jgi:hypothetical protein
VDVRSGHVAFVAMGSFHDFVQVVDFEVCCVGFEGGETVTEIGCGQWRVVRERLRTEMTAERSARQNWPSRVSS